MDNSIEHVFNDCKVTKEIRTDFMNKCKEYDYYPSNALNACNELYYSYIPHLEVASKNPIEKVPKKVSLVRVMKGFVRNVYMLLWEKDKNKKEEEKDLLNI